MALFKTKISYTQTIMLSFLAIILIGTFFLCLPISSKDGSFTPILDSMFTATSATCVTGLIVYDTFTHWSLFGQFVIMILIQIGGLGVLTCIAVMSIALKKRIGLGERRLLMQSAGSLQISGVVTLVRKIVIGTFVVELSAAILLTFVFVPRLGLVEGIWYSIFHSVSAFCNAGFDLMGRYTPFSSLSHRDFAFDPLLNGVVMSLIVAGGIGFIVWRDIANHRFKFKDYQLHSKIVLLTTAILIFGGAILFFIFEYKYSLGGLSLPNKIMASFFQSISPRTAGFNTVDLSKLSPSGAMLQSALMLIGGSPGSTAGGIKTTTFFVLILGAFTSARRYGSITIFKRKLDEETALQASSIITVYLSLLVISVMLISAFDSHSFMQVFYECCSALGTVGLTTGITPELGSASRFIIILLMYTGRIGGLSLMLVLAEKRRSVPMERPNGKILIG